MHEPTLVRDLNRKTRKRTAKLSFDAEIPFGESLFVRRYRLGNGLRVLILVDRSAPVVSYQTWYRVGSRNERPTKTGLAHLFEHLMFNETKSLPAGEFDRLLEAAGGETNAATWTDWTYYYENVPKEALPLVVRLESDRMQNLVLRDAQVSSEKEVVANERRQRVDDDVEGAAGEKLYALAFDKHPYRWPTIGFMQDIEGFDIDDCRAFYRTYYAPNNATVVIGGDLDEEHVLELVQVHYGGIRKAELPAEKRVVEPKKRGERRAEMVWPTPSPKVQIGYHAPAFGDSDWAVLTVAHEILLGGRSSRLYRELVEEKELAAEVHASLSPFRDPGIYDIWISVRPARTVTEVMRTTQAALARLKKKAVDESELEKAKNRLELGFLEAMETVGGKASEIGFYETVLGDAGRVFSRLEDYRRVTARDVLRVCNQVFDDDRRAVVIVRPASSEPMKGSEPKNGSEPKKGSEARNGRTKRKTKKAKQPASPTKSTKRRAS